jgi:TonB family protein
MVCGQVVETTCQSSGDDVLLTLASGLDAAPFRIRIPASGVEALGRGVPHKYQERVVCAVGTIEQRSAGFEVVAREPQPVTEPAELNTTSPPVFAPDAFGACDANTRVPTVIRDVKPTYTARALRDQAAGAVLILAVVKPDGSVSDMTVRQSLHPELDREALAAAGGWRFKPGTYQGEPVPMAVSIKMAFVTGK